MDIGEPLEVKATVSPDAISFGLKPVADVSVAVKVKVGDALTVIAVGWDRVSTGVSGFTVWVTGDAGEVKKLVSVTAGLKVAPME